LCTIEYRQQPTQDYRQLGALQQNTTAIARKAGHKPYIRQPLLYGAGKTELKPGAAASLWQASAEDR
jgi:hypothetical protein